MSSKEGRCDDGSSPPTASSTTPPDSVPPLQRLPPLPPSAKPQELIHLHVGGCGGRVGDTMWHLYCLEHELVECVGVESDIPSHDDPASPRLRTELPPAFGAFFRRVGPSRRRRWVPRCLFVDSDLGALDAIRNGPMGSLYHPRCFVGCKESDVLVEKALEEARRLAEECGTLAGFVVTHGVGGDTGSGVSGRILRRLCEDYAATAMTLNWSVFSGAQSAWPKLESESKPHRADLNDREKRVSPGVLKPSPFCVYNEVLSMFAIMEDTDVCVMLENSALASHAIRRMELPSPSPTCMNDEVALLMSATTASMRMDGAVNVDMTELQTNLVPLPEAKFVISSVAPLYSSMKGCKNPWSRMDVREMVNESFEFSNFSVSSSPEKGKFMAVSMMFRGLVFAKDVGASLKTLKSRRSIQFVDWSPTGFRWGTNYENTVMLPFSSISAVPRSVCNLANSTTVRFCFAELKQQFDSAFKLRTFETWKTRKVEEDELGDASEVLQCTINDLVLVEGEGCVVDDEEEEEEEWEDESS